MTMLARLRVATVSVVLSLFAAQCALAASSTSTPPPAQPKQDIYPSQETSHGDTAGGPSWRPGPGEDWKGSSPTNQGTLSALFGMSVLNQYRPGFTLIGAASKRILDHGFIPDFNDTVSVEAELGPVFALGGTAFYYSAHLRWDFLYNPDWTFYALGGLAGSVQGDTFGNHFILLPRFGIGAIWTLSDVVGIRGELSPDLIVVGATFPY